MGRRQHVWSNSPVWRVGWLGRSNSPNGRVGRLARSNSPIWRVGWLARFNSPVLWVGRWVFRCPESVVRGLEQPFLKTYFVNPFRNRYETLLSFSRLSILLNFILLFQREHFPRDFRHWFRCNQFWPQQLPPSSLEFLRSTCERLGRSSKLGKLMVGSGLFTLLKVECGKIGAAPWKGLLRTLVEGIKHFVVRFGVKSLTTSFPVRPLRSSCVSCRDYRACFCRWHSISDLCRPRE